MSMLQSMLNAIAPLILAPGFITAPFTRLHHSYMVAVVGLCDVRPWRGVTGSLGQDDGRDRASVAQIVQLDTTLGH